MRKLLLFLVSIPAFAQPIRINCGGAVYTDPSGNVWATDSGFTGTGLGVSSTASAITGTTTPVLYQTGRFGSPLTYTFIVPAGSYTVNLKFAEFVSLSVGSRVFNVAINGTQVLTSFDVYAAVGGFVALDKSFPVTVAGTTITIAFTSVVSNPKVNAIEIVQATGSCCAGAAGPMGPQGPAGADGAIGPPGPQGISGVQGLDGPAGVNGAVGPIGSIGPTGVAGPMGPSGPVGPAGPSIGFQTDTAVILSRQTDQDNTDHIFVPSGMNGSTYWGNLIPALTAYKPNAWFMFTPQVNCSSGASIDINGLGPMPLQKLSGGVRTALAANDCIATIPYMIRAHSATPPVVDAFLLTP